MINHKLGSIVHLVAMEIHYKFMGIMALKVNIYHNRILNVLSGPCLDKMPACPPFMIGYYRGERVNLFSHNSEIEKQFY